MSTAVEFIFHTMPITIILWNIFPLILLRRPVTPCNENEERMAVGTAHLICKQNMFFYAENAM